MAVSGEHRPLGGGSPFPREFDSKAPFLNVKLYVLIGILALCALCVALLAYLCVRLRRASRKRRALGKNSSGLIPLVSKEIVEIKAVDRADRSAGGAAKVESVVVVEFEGEKRSDAEIASGSGSGSGSGVGGKKSGESDGASSGSRSDAAAAAEVHGNIGWGRWYSLRELEVATCGFAAENVIGEGGYGIVYRGVLDDGSVVAVKSLLNNKGQAEKEFKVEVEAIGKVRHKNLVGLIGYCAEGAKRILVYEYVDNGNLEQWLHGDVGSVSPLTWDIRMKIAIGTAKGLAYLHEGLEPKVVHRDVKSSNILLTRKWNPKVSDFGLAKLLGPDASYVTTRVMGTFGYVSPDYASTGMLNEGSDVYSFGVLLMELITGRSPIDYSRPAGEMNLVDWFRGMVASRRGEDIVDPLIADPPSQRAFKRAILVCLRCVDLDSIKRPKMGQIVHMLEADDFPFRAQQRLAQERDCLASQQAQLSGIPEIPRPRKHAGAGDAER